MSWNLTRLRLHVPLGYRQLVEAISTDSFGPARTIVISGNPVGEGALISETALRELRPRRYIVRGTKLFADVGWMGQVVDLHVRSAAQVHTLLLSLPVDLVVIDRVDASPYAYQSQLLEALAGHPEQWRFVDHPARDQRLVVFRRAVDGPLLSSSQIEMQLNRVLAKPIP
jgi:hypothetical protein